MLELIDSDEVLDTDEVFDSDELVDIRELVDMAESYSTSTSGPQRCSQSPQICSERTGRGNTPH